MTKVRRSAAETARLAEALKRREARAKTDIARRLQEAEANLAHWTKVCAADKARQRRDALPPAWRDEWGMKVVGLLEKGLTPYELVLMGYPEHELKRRGFV